MGGQRRGEFHERFFGSHLHLGTAEAWFKRPSNIPSKSATSESSDLLCSHNAAKLPPNGACTSAASTTPASSTIAVLLWSTVATFGRSYERTPATDFRTLWSALVLLS